MNSLRNNYVRVIQFNCNSIYARLSEFRKMLIHSQPEVLCLCETWLSNKEPKFHNYSAVWKHRVGPCGGLGILIRNDLTFKLANLANYNNGFLEHQCIQLKLYNQNQWINIMNFYNPCKNITKSELSFYIHQLGNKFIMTGDLNAHTPILDNKYHTSVNYTGNSL